MRPMGCEASLAEGMREGKARPPNPAIRARDRNCCHSRRGAEVISRTRKPQNLDPASQLLEVTVGGDQNRAVKFSNSRGNAVHVRNFVDSLNLTSFKRLRKIYRH